MIFVQSQYNTLENFFLSAIYLLTYKNQSSDEEFNYSFKGFALIPERKFFHNIKMRFEYASAFLYYDVLKCIFLNKIGVSIAMQCAYGFQKKQYNCKYYKKF